MTTFAGYLVSLIVGPMANRWGAAYARALGGSLDGAADAILEAGRVAGPGDAQDDALSRLGASRGIPALAGEPEASYRARLVGAWDSWTLAGTREGVAYNVSLLGLGTPAVWPWHELRWDTDAARWARVAVVFRGLPAWDCDALWDADDVWDSPRSAEGIEGVDAVTVRPQMRRILRQWVNARDVVEHVRVIRGGLLWDLDALWDADDVWDAGDGETLWSAPEWDTDETGAVWDAPTMAWDSFC